jgi:hypothetical protein
VGEAVEPVSASSEARLLNWFIERAESVEDRRAVSLIAKVLDGDDDAMVVAYKAWTENGGSTAGFYRALVETREALEPERTHVSDVVKALGAVRGLQVEELEGDGRNGFIAWVPRKDGITGPDGDGMGKLLAGTMWPDAALEGLTG